jgi:hypothetical protein
MLLACRETRSFFAVVQKLSVHHQTVERCVERALPYGPLAALDDLARPGKEPVPTANPNSSLALAYRLIVQSMSDLGRLTWCALIGLFRPRTALETENLVLRDQLNVLQRKSPSESCLAASPAIAGRALSPGSRGAGRCEDHKAGEAHPLAPCWLPSLLALEIPTARWPPADTGRYSSSHSREEHRQPALGRFADPRTWRARTCLCRRTRLSPVSSKGVYRAIER